MSLTWHTSSHNWGEWNDQCALAARQDRILDTVVAYRYMAPAYLAYEERRDNALARLAQDQFLGDAAHDEQRPATRANWSFSASILRRGPQLVASCWRRLRRRPGTDHAAPAPTLTIADEAR